MVCPYRSNSYQPRKFIFSARIVFWAMVLGLAIIFWASSCNMNPIPAHAAEIPDNLYMGIVAEETSGDMQAYLMIASVVRNRLDKGMDTGLVALKRTNLEHFFWREYQYAIKVKGIDLAERAYLAINKVFNEGKDYANGATNYEHTGVYPIPKYTKRMKLVKVIYPNSKNEIRFWVAR